MPSAVVVLVNAVIGTVIAGLERPDTGQVVIGGEIATWLPPQRRNVGFGFQRHAAVKHMTGRDGVGFNSQVHVTTILVTHDQEEAISIASFVVMNRIEPAGSPAERYANPATEFVMSFVGKVIRLGGIYVRPHAVIICAAGAPGCEPAVIERLLSLGCETRIELRLQHGRRVAVALSRGRASGWHPIGKPAPPPTLLPVVSRDARPVARDA